MKRLLAFFSAVIMLVSVTVPVASTAEAYHGEVHSFYSEGYSGSLQGSLSQPTVQPEGLYDFVVGKMKTCTAVIDISRYRITEDQLTDLMMDITNSEPEFFHLQNTWDYYMDYTDTFVTVFEPSYSMDLTEYTVALEYVRAEAKKALSGVNPKWGELEKALYLHDYIIAWYEYDTNLVIEDIYHFLKAKKGVCEGYQLYYMYLLNQLGIENDYIASVEMRHVWNRVKIDGEWYNVDLTWDDPSNNHMAETNHKYFLLSDAAMSDHTGGVSDKVCTDTTYDNFVWKDTHAAIVYLNGHWYTILHDYICHIDPYTGTTEKVLKLTERWPADANNRYWVDSLSGISVYKGCLIFITPKSFVAYNPELNYAKVLATYTGEEYLFDGVVDPETGRYYVTLGDSKDHDGVTWFYQIKDADLPLSVIWEEYDRDDATCINPGLIYYRAEGDPGLTKTETTHAHGHRPGIEKVDVRDESGAVVASYQLCHVCGSKCNLTPVKSEGFDGRFIDVKPKDWFAAAVSFAVERGLFGGVSANSFAPNTDMSRAMLVTVLWRMEGQPAPAGGNPFNDVPENTWYTTPVIWAYERGIVGGVGNGKYAPDNTVTREQMATILYRYSVDKGYDLEKSAGIANFPDTDEVSAYAVDAYSWARTQGIVDGMGKGDGKIYLNPRGYATRAQVATMLTRFIVYLCG